MFDWTKSFAVVLIVILSIIVGFLLRFWKFIDQDHDQNLGSEDQRSTRMLILLLAAAGLSIVAFLLYFFSHLRI